MVTIAIDLPEQTAAWLTAEGEKEFRTPAEEASVLIRKLHRKAKDEVRNEILGTIKPVEEIGFPESRFPCKPNEP